MRWRRIAENEIESAIRQPDFIEPSVEGRLNAWIETAGIFLRVTYTENADNIIVITAVKKRKGWRRWFYMKIEYDKTTDALYIQLKEAYVDDNIDIAKWSNDPQ